MSFSLLALFQKGMENQELGMLGGKWVGEGGR